MRNGLFSILKPLLLVFAIFSLGLFSSFKTENDDAYSTSFRVYFNDHSNRLNEDVLKLYNVVKKSDYRLDSAKSLLSLARNEYKYIEGFIRYFLPGDARRLNNPIILEMEEDDEIGAYVVPHGFQYIEQLLYSDSVKYFQKKIRDEVDDVYLLTSHFNESASLMIFKERDVFEALQIQNIRQFMLGFANFETGGSRAGVPESAATLLAIKYYLMTVYPDPGEKNTVLFNDLFFAIDKAVSSLRMVKPGDDPDYLDFYLNCYIPVSDKLERLRQQIVSENLYYTTAVNFQVRSIFDPNAFNSFFFLPSKHLLTKEPVIELGRTLFFDPALSANNLRACASCHRPGMGFTDGMALSESFEPGRKLTRNAPTIVNSVLQRKLFHDGRAFTFEDQAGQVMSNPLEMHNDFSVVAIKLRNSPEYVKWFRKAYAGTEDTLISNRSILTAIAEYERSIIGMNSRFDKTISGREDAMNQDEKTGFNIFMGKGNCASCHFIPLFNGVMPPDYVETEWEILGVPAAKIAAKRELDADIGRAGVINVPIFRHAFKIPTLRNIEITGPYMHNGVFKTLEEVVEFYDIGGGRGLGYDVPYQTLSDEPLHLTSLEKFQLVSFLKSLTDTIGLTSIPGRLPQFPDNELMNGRPIGGDY